MIWNLTPGLRLADLPWRPAGPPEDRRALLEMTIVLGGTPMLLYAVEVLKNRHDQIASKAPDLQGWISSIQFLAGSVEYLQQVILAGRRYFVIAVPARRDQ